MRRRDFIKLLGGAAVGWPLVARAQQGERVRRVGAVFPFSENDPQSTARVAALRQGLQQLGWTDGHNMRIETRWFAGNPDDNRRNAVELVALAPDVIFASGSATLAPLLQATRSIPI